MSKRILSIADYEETRRLSFHSSSSSAGMSRWWLRMPRSAVQNARRRAELWPTSNRSKGSRVQASLKAWPTRVSNGISSTINRLSFIMVLVNSGFLTESRPTSARNWISWKDTGDTPQGRYRSNQLNFSSRLDWRTSQIRKWVSSRTVTVRTAAVNPRRAQGATPTTTDLRRQHEGPSAVFLYCVEFLAVLVSFSSSRRSTIRSPRRSTAITSPRRASSRRRNQCFLASEAFTVFICTMYKRQRLTSRL
jgi:hypothetical protein